MRGVLKDFNNNKVDNCLACNAYEIQEIFTLLDKYHVFKCCHCELLFINPMPTNEYMEDYYNNSFDHKFIIPPPREKENEEIIRLIFKNLDYEKETAITNKINFFEIGIGKGDFIRQIAQYGLKVRGSDLSKKMVVKNHSFQIDYGRFEDFRYTNQFDVVYSSHVLEHSNNPVEFVKALHRSLNSGGIAVVRVPNMDSSYFKLANLVLGEYKWFTYLPVPAHLTVFNIECLSLLFKNIGFEIKLAITLPLISNLIVSYISILTRFFILRIMPILGVTLQPSSLMKTHNNRLSNMQKIFNLLMHLCKPIDKIWVMITWPFFRRFNMGEEILLIARKV